MGAWVSTTHLEFGYDALTRELREYRGPSNIRIDGSSRTNVRIDFPPEERRKDVAQEDIGQAAGMALTGRCL
jgi:hypothetical protein